MKCHELLCKTNEENAVNYLLLCAAAMTSNNKLAAAIELYERCLKFYREKYGDKEEKVIGIYLKLIPLHIECNNTVAAFGMIDEFVLRVWR